MTVFDLYAYNPHPTHTPSHPAPCKFIQDNLSIPDSRYWIQDSLFVDLGIGIPMTLTGFRIHWAKFQIPKPRIPDSTIKNFPDSGLLITERLSVEWIEAIKIFNEPRFLHKMLMIAVYIFFHIYWSETFRSCPCSDVKYLGHLPCPNFYYQNLIFVISRDLKAYTSWIPVILITPVFEVIVCASLVNLKGNESIGLCDQTIVLYTDFHNKMPKLWFCGKTSSKNFTIISI